MRGETPVTSGQLFNVQPINVVPSDENCRHNSGLNVSLQTGEEFSEEFLRERLTPRRPVIIDAFQQQQNRMGINIAQSRPLVYEDLTGLLGLQRKDSESGTELSEFSPQGGGYALDAENRESFGGANRYRMEYTTTNGQQQGRLSDGSNIDRTLSGLSIYPSDSPYAYQPHNSGLGYTDGSFPGKMKFLCSFGGRILPRPKDGKLRYVGGETRIMSIRKNLTYSELVRKTAAICNQPHTIKYQLPGEDLDALISVSSDEDLHHMIEEYHDLERTSQRLRIFLISSNDPESPCSFEARTGPQGDADYQYVVAVNGMLDPSPWRSSSRESLGSQMGNALDSSPVQRDSPISFHPLEVPDGGSSSNRMSNPSSKVQVFNTPQYPSKSILSSSVSPVPVQINDPRSCYTKLYEDMTRSNAYEFNSPNAAEQPSYDKYQYFNNTSYYHHQPPEAVQLRNYFHPVSHCLDSNQIPELDPHIHSTGKSVVASPSCGQLQMDKERHMVNEIAMQSENLSFPQDTAGVFPGIGTSFKTHNRMVHAVSQPQLRQKEEVKVTVEERNPFPSNYVVEKSPSYGDSSQKWLVQQLESSEKYQNARDENLSTPDLNKEFMWTENEGTTFDQDRTHNMFTDRNTSNSTLVEDNINLHEIVRPVDQMLIDCPLPVEPEGNTSRNSTSHSLTSENSQPRGHQSGPNESEYLIRSQKESETRAKAFSRDAINNSCGLKSSTHQGMDRPVDESCLLLDLNYPLSNDLSFPNPADSAKQVGLDTVHKESVHDPEFEMVKGPHKSVKKESLKEDSSETSCFPDQMSVSHPSTDQHDGIRPESTVVVEDVTDSIPPDIPSSLVVIPLVQDEPSDGTETESVAIESDHEEGNVDHDGNVDPLGDAALIEIEAGIYGLQIIKYADLEELQELGSGTFGTVYHGKWRGTDVAIKRIKKSCFAGRNSEQERLTKEFWREAQILSKLHHPNIVAFYGVVPDGPGGTLATVTEYMVDGSLKHALLRKGALDRRKKLMIALDTAFGMEYLHLKNIVHFDLKCDNLLVNLGDPQRPVCKVGDFGLSRIKRNTLVSGGVRGTLPWMAPELLHGSSNRVSEKVDVFSFGITMWEIQTGEEPYANLHCGAIIGGIVNNTLRPSIPERCDPEWRKLMEECWSPDPAARPSFTQITNRLRIMSKALQPTRQIRARR
ncbi:unnamed protein product [Coffea canephora]|uniref:Protein kinase domain-containing protein n=1 Tax=Coffea canephora TaxID=49390 RepID=A0A068TTM6_COFCA|nr:unnamed protein product [Coffea canephora]